MFPPPTNKPEPLLRASGLPGIHFLKNIIYLFIYFNNVYTQYWDSDSQPQDHESHDFLTEPARPHSLEYISKTIRARGLARKKAGERSSIPAVCLPHKFWKGTSPLATQTSLLLKVIFQPQGTIFMKVLLCKY